MRKPGDADIRAQELYLSFIGDMLEQYVQWLRKWYGVAPPIGRIPSDDEAAID